MNGQSLRRGLLWLSLLVVAMPSIAAAPPSWTPAVTSDFMMIYGDAAQGAALTLNGVPVGLNGSVLAAFAPGVTNAVGNYQMGSQPPALGAGEFLMTIYGNDAASGKNGAAAGDNVTFKLYYEPTQRIYSAYTVFDNDAAVPGVFYASFMTDPILQPHLVTLHFRNQAPAIAVDGGISRLNYPPGDNAARTVVYRLSDPDEGDVVVVDNVVFRPAIDNASWVAVFVDGVRLDNVVRASDNSATWFQLGTGGGNYGDNVSIVVTGPVAAADQRVFTVTLVVEDDVGSPTPVTPIQVQDNAVSIAAVPAGPGSDDSKNWFEKAFGCSMAPAGARRDEASGVASILVMLLPAAVMLIRRRR